MCRKIAKKCTKNPAEKGAEIFPEEEIEIFFCTDSCRKTCKKYCIKIPAQNPTENSAEKRAEIFFKEKSKNFPAQITAGKRARIGTQT